MSKFLRFFTLLFFCLVYVYVHSLPINQGCTINKLVHQNMKNTLKIIQNVQYR